jgi:hypothetical protein
MVACAYVGEKVSGVFVLRRAPLTMFLASMHDKTLRRGWTDDKVERRLTIASNAQNRFNFDLCAKAMACKQK